MTTNGVKYTISMQNAKPKLNIPEINKQSLMLMIKQIMQKSDISHDQLDCVVQESNECSESMIQNYMIDSEQPQKTNNNQERQLYFLKDTDNCKPLQVSAKKQTDQNLKIQKQNPEGIRQPSLNKNTSESFLSSNQTTEFDKLIEITSRCVEYYNNFIKQKSTEFNIIQKTFTDLNTNLDMAFNQIITEAQKKQKQLKEFLLKKYKEIIDYRQNQDNGLKNTLQNIRSVHLNNIIKKQTLIKEIQTKNCKKKLFLSLNSKLQTQASANDISSQRNLLNSSESQQSDNLSLEMHNYATTLNEFYLQMQEIQKSNFKEIVQESVSFINNLICEELKVLMTERIPSKLCQKRMLRENSKDFLMEDNENFEGKNNNITENLAFLDFQSFTKLFLDNSKLNNNCQEEQKKQNKNIEEIISLIEKKNQPAVKKKIFDPSKQNVSVISKNEKLSQSRSKSKTKTTYQVTTNLKREKSLNTDRSNKSINKTTSFLKKEHRNQQFIEVNNNRIHTEDLHKQNSLQLIQKISSQQNNRSAKIKNYMVSFQDTTNKTKNPLKVNQNRKEDNKIIKTSKSPQKLSKTPNKMTKSIQKKGFVSANHLKTESDLKLKSSQQTSLKSSRNSGYVSQFKISTSRRQSVALK